MVIEFREEGRSREREGEAERERERERERETSILCHQDTCQLGTELAN